ncbi:ATP-binding protein, partial [Acinetobacter nosocomialis]|uniref:ATP-binding protein n=1 Tax=Acinetobacter nosocomialis TaxID=106654 RepID=UPI0030F4EB98
EFIPLFIQEDLADVADQIQFNIDVPLAIQFDEAQLRQILINLIRNAIRHNSPDSSHIQLNIHSYEHKVWIDVRDVGS